MDKPVKSLLYCLLFLLAVEAGLRVAEPFAARPDAFTLPADDCRPLCLILGSSRSIRGVDPLLVEAELAAVGWTRPWTANLSEYGVTCVGLYRRYMEQIHDWAGSWTDPGNRRPGRTGILAIELRGSGLNDNYQTERELAWLSQGGDAIKALDLEEPSSLFDLRYRLNPEAAARSLVLGLRLATVRESIGTLPRALGLTTLISGGELRGEEWAAAGLPPALASRNWTHGTRGYVPVDEQIPDLEQDHWSKRYRNTLLREFQLGGRQTACLRQLIRQARKDGFTPLLYLMPVTPLHRTFYGLGEFEAYLTHVHQLAREEGIRLIDLDSGNDLDREDFRDTNHLRPQGAEKVSRQLGQRIAQQVPLYPCPSP